MTPTPDSPGRRERNKQQKLDRITGAARELFLEHGVDDVTTQQIADRADIGTGTLFLYAKNKAELLLLVQNSTYADALDRGRIAASEAATAIDAVLAVLTPVVECNRAQVANGRSYLREIVFGDPDESHHRAAIELTFATEQAVAENITRLSARSLDEAALVARVVSAIMFLTLSNSANTEKSIGELVDDLRTQIGLLLP